MKVKTNFNIIMKLNYFLINRNYGTFRYIAFNIYIM